MPNPSLLKNSSSTIWIKPGDDKGVYSFLKGISLKMNTIAWVEFELIYYNMANLHVSY